MTVNLQVGNAQVIGARTEQQDAFGFSDKDDKCFVRHGGLLAVVADGMGGHAYGGEASRIAVKAFLQAYMAKPRQAPIIDALCLSFHAANNAVCKFSEAAGEAGNCGTTLIAAVVHPASRSLYWIGTGDSRILLFRGLQWVQVTTDTNYANQQLSHHIQGDSLTYDWESDGHPQGLTSFLGLQEIQEIDRSLRGFRLHPGDWLVLCTDGVYNTLTVDEILPILRGEPNDACERIVQEVLVKSLNHQDNATVAIIACNFGAAYARYGNWIKAQIAKFDTYRRSLKQTKGSPQCFALNVASLRRCVRPSFCFLALPLWSLAKIFSHATTQRKSGSEENNVSN